MTTTAIDLTPLLQDGITAAGIVLIAVATWAAHKIGARAGAEANTAQQANYDQALRKTLAGALLNYAEQIQMFGNQHPALKQSIIDSAAQAIVSFFPKTAAAVGVKKPADAAVALTRLYGTLQVVKGSNGVPQSGAASIPVSLPGDTHA
jgi:hypothetical protein